MIVGTAGHIDHGKTTLVRALTGVDTDRLPEEKKRGISIELGYAFLDVPSAKAPEFAGLEDAAGFAPSLAAAGASADLAAPAAAAARSDPADRAARRGAAPAGQLAGPGARAAEQPARIAFIDVPGHERLLHTMVAGATGIDYALLLVAADDGVMPQTHEHLAVLSLLGVSRGAVVVTKADRADAARLAAVCAEAAALLAGTPLAGSPVLPVAALTGQGLAPLRAQLFAAAAEPARGAATPRAAFRLAVDRAFTLDGVGTVATGTVHAGSVAVGDELRLLPGGPAALLRVRSVHAQNRALGAAHAGQRCALALAGIAKDDVTRGQWLVAPAVALATRRIDVQLTLWRGEPGALRSGSVVQVHLGAAAVQGSVALLEADALAPGAGGLAQLVLRGDVGAWHGDRVVLRDASASRTLAGGVVLDPQAPARYRRTPQRLAELAVLRGAPTPEARLAALLDAAPHGLALAAFAAAQGQADVALPDGALLHGGWALGAAPAQAAEARLHAALAAFHAAHPDELGPDAARLRRLALPRLAEPLFGALLARLQQRGALARRGAFVHLPEHGVRLSASEQRIAEKVAPLLAGAGFEGAWARDLAKSASEGEPLMRATLARLAQRGELHQVVKDLYYPQASIARLAALARGVAAAQGGEVTAGAFRDATQLGRKRAIQLLEYFDRVGLLRRVGDVHRLRAESVVFA